MGPKGLGIGLAIEIGGDVLLASALLDRAANVCIRDRGAVGQPMVHASIVPTARTRNVLLRLVRLKLDR